MTNEIAAIKPPHHIIAILTKSDDPLAIFPYELTVDLPRGPHTYRFANETGGFFRVKGAEQGLKFELAVV